MVTAVTQGKMGSWWDGNEGRVAGTHARRLGCQGIGVVPESKAQGRSSTAARQGGTGAARPGSTPKRGKGEALWPEWLMHTSGMTTAP
jgi:hypothetical protein